MQMAETDDRLEAANPQSSRVVGLEGQAQEILNQPEPYEPELYQPVVYHLSGAFKGMPGLPPDIESPHGSRTHQVLLACTPANPELLLSNLN